MNTGIFSAAAAQARTHIAQSEAETASRAAADARTQATAMQLDVEKLFMITEALWNILKEHGVLVVRGEPVNVVLTDKHHRQRPDGCKVDRFMKRPLTRCAVSEECDNSATVPLVLAAPGGAHGDWNPTGHNAVGAQHAHSEVSDMHGSPAPLAAAGAFREELGHDGIELGPFGKAMTMSPVRTRYVVLLREMRAHARSHGLLPIVLVHRSRHDTRQKKLVELPFEPADANHLGVETNGHFFVHVYVSLLCKSFHLEGNQPDRTRVKTDDG